MPDPNELQYSLELNTEGFKQGVKEAQEELARMQQAAAQMGQQGASGGVASGGSFTPPSPAPGTPAAQSNNALQSAWEKLAQIQETAKSAPDVAMLQLQGAGGRGGLQSQIAKGAIAASEEERQAYQDLISALKDVSKEVRKQTEDGGKSDPATSLLGFLRADMMLRAGGGVLNSAMQGDVLGAAGGGAGAGLGMLLGGPAGAAAGAQIGQMLAGILAPFVGGANETEKRAIDRADIAARLGDFSANESLRTENLRNDNDGGYSAAETMQLLDVLRRDRVISGVDEESTGLAQQIQQMSRAFGETAEAIARDYGRYENVGGTQDASGYMAQVVGGAVAAGMRANLDQYREVLGSAQMQMVYRSGIGDVNDGGMIGAQRILQSLMGQNNMTSDLLQNNPMLAQQMLGNMLQSGASRGSFSVDASLMQMAGIDAAHTTEGYISPERQAQNAIQRQGLIGRGFLQMAGGAIGGDMNQLYAQAQANPNLIQDLLSDRNPNTAQAKSLQGALDVQIATVLGKPLDGLTGGDRQLSMQMLQAMLSNGGQIAPDTVLADGKTVEQALAESQKTEGQQTRDSIADVSDSINSIKDEFLPIMQDLRTNAGKVVEYLAEIAGPIATISTAVMETLGIGKEQESGGVYYGGREGRAETPAAQPNIFQRGVNFLEELTPLGTVQRGARAAVNFLPGTLRAIERMVDQPDAAFNDTPMGGVQAASGYDTFQFRPGDIVTARQPLSEGGSQAAPINANITVSLTVPSGADSTWIEDAARRGTNAGFDTFVEQWQGRRRGGGGAQTTNY